MKKQTCPLFTTLKARGECNLRWPSTATLCLFTEHSVGCRYWLAVTWRCDGIRWVGMSHLCESELADVYSAVWSVGKRSLQTCFSFACTSDHLILIRWDTQPTVFLYIGQPTAHFPFSHVVLNCIFFCALLISHFSGLVAFISCLRFNCRCNRFNLRTFVLAQCNYSNYKACFQTSAAHFIRFYFPDCRLLKVSCISYKYLLM